MTELLGGLEPLPLLARLQASFDDEVRATDPDAPVPACGDWRVRDLVLHLAGVHRWAAGRLRGERVSDVVEPDGRELAAVYADCAAELRAALADVPPETTVRTLTGDGPASFWHRRQVHETLVHLHDLRAAALGSGPAVAVERPIDVPTAVWADCVDEVVTMFQPRQVAQGRMAPPSRAVRLVAPDVGRSWVLGASAAAPDAPDASAEPDATVTAPAHGLALLLWHRIDAARAGVVVSGDRAAADEVLAEPLVP